MAAVGAMHMEDGKMVVGLGSNGGRARLLGGDGCCNEEGEVATAETMLQPTLAEANAFVSELSLTLAIEACGRSLSVVQSPSLVQITFWKLIKCLRSR
ncbi:hypothetical protein ACJRO7_007530 [Eucalyptus globulus]|uniref:RNase H type-1 domain-containing protein n=1 Tax=Eucalyptus globulus TaxID=34317 RepID=A0ABD3ILG5_EUCGL